MSSMVSSTDLDETGGGLWILVLRRRPLRLSCIAIEKVVPLPTPFPNPVLMIEPHVEPDRAVECAMLIQAEPGQIVVKDLRRAIFRKVTVSQPPIRDRSRHSMHQLTNRALATALARIRAIRDVAIEIFRHRDLCRQRTPGFRDLNILLTKDHLPAVIRDLGGATLPFDLIKGRNALLTEKALKLQSALLPRSRSSSARSQITGPDTCFQFNHLGAFLNFGSAANKLLITARFLAKFLCLTCDFPVITDLTTHYIAQASSIKH